MDTGRHKNRCVGYATCKYFRSCEDKAVSDAAKMARIASLPAGAQTHIADMYYGGKMPWAEPTAQ